MASPSSLETQKSALAPVPCTTPAGTGAASIGDASAEQFRRDGVVHLEGVFADWVDVLRAGVERNMHSPGPLHEGVRTGGLEGLLLRRLLQLGANSGISRLRTPLARRGAGGTTDGFDHGSVLPRARAGEGASDRIAHPLAPRSALLLHRRDADREFLDPARPGSALGVPGAGRGIPSVGEVVPAEENSSASTTSARERRSTPSRTSTRAATSSRSLRSTWRRATPSPSTS